LKREIDLTPYVQPIMDLAEKTSKQDFLILALLGEGGFRRGEVVGNRDRREIWPLEKFENAKRKSEIPLRKAILARLSQGIPRVQDRSGNIYSLIREGRYVLKMRHEDPLPGLQIEDFHDGSVWVKGKGGTLKAQPLPSWLYKEVQAYFGDRKSGKAFDLSSDYVYKLCRKYGRLVGIPERAGSYPHPHRWRHYYITSVYRKTKNPIMTMKLARHKDFDTTVGYIEDYELEDKKAIVEELFA
jgi:integrase